MKRGRRFQWVRVADPVRVVARFWDADRVAVIGAGGMRFASPVLSELGRVVDAGTDGTRVLVQFPGFVDADGCQQPALWLDAEQLESAAAEGRKRCRCEHPKHEGPCRVDAGCWCGSVAAA